MCSGHYMCGQNPAVCGLTAWISVIYCSHVEFNHQIRDYARRFIQEKKFGTILLTGREKGSGKLYYGRPHLVYMQCSYAMLMNAEHKHVTALLTHKIDTGAVCTDSA